MRLLLQPFVEACCWGGKSRGRQLSGEQLRADLTEGNCCCRGSCCFGAGHNRRWLQRFVEACCCFCVDPTLLFEADRNERLVLLLPLVGLCCCFLRSHHGGCEMHHSHLDIIMMRRSGRGFALRSCRCALDETTDRALIVAVELDLQPPSFLPLRRPIASQEAPCRPSGILRLGSFGAGSIGSCHACERKSES